MRSDPIPVLAEFEARLITALGADCDVAPKHVNCDEQHSCRRFIGAAAQDAAGLAFASDLEHHGVRAHIVSPPPAAASEPSAVSLCLVTPDGQRTMRTCLGAAQHLTEDTLPVSALEACNLLHCEGYTLYKPAMLRKALQHARQHGARTSLDLGSYEAVQHCQEPLLEILEEGLIDLFFCNEDEAAALQSIVPSRSGGARPESLLLLCCDSSKSEAPSL